MGSQSLIFFFAIIFILAGVLLAVITFTRRAPKQLNVDKYRSSWMSIEQRLRRDDEASYQLTILDADKLLDQALRERGLAGETMAERLKSARKLLTHSNYLWTAHKLRNRIAHETNVRVSYDDARRALSDFKQALKDIGAI